MERDEKRIKQASAPIRRLLESMFYFVLGEAGPRSTKRLARAVSRCHGNANRLDPWPIPLESNESSRPMPHVVAHRRAAMAAYPHDVLPL